MVAGVFEALLDELRALGGAAENICLREGPLGRGLFAVDPARPVALHVPAPLLIAADDMVFAHGALKVGPNVALGARARAFLDAYQRELGWGAEGRAEILRGFERVHALPQSLRAELLARYDCGLWFEDINEALIRRQFFDARCISFAGRTTVMPFVELANHGHGGDYLFEDGLALRGTFAGEVLVSYAPFDAFEFFRNWGFASDQPAALSIPVAGNVGAQRLHIGRSFPATKRVQRAWMPGLRRDAGEDAKELGLDYLMIGNLQYPRLARGIFYHLMRDAGFEGFEEAFDLIRHVNQLHFLDLLEMLEGVSVPVAATMRQMARLQLRAISSSYGVRAI
ncbi:MAG TPA: hypothetical protein VG889_20760 [Rhizomicrobium sp.]|nr:hypothetical protein [Rhizomicrobium sp.]